MNLSIFVVGVVLTLLQQIHGEIVLPRELGSFKLDHAGFIEVFENDIETEVYSDRFTLYITTFNYLALLSKDPVYRLDSPGSHLNDVQNWKSKLIQMGGANTAYWPNNPTHLPKKIAGFNGMIQTSGFLVPTKTYGQLEVYNLDSGEGPWNMASDVSGKDWSYHSVIWIDIDGDGLEDALTARFHVGTFGGTTSELIYLKNPGGLTDTAESWTHWKEHLLISGGPDVLIEMTILKGVDGKEYSVLVTGELWTERIMLYYVPNIPGAWLDTDNIKSVVIDSNPGQPFEASIADVNADGKLEILASAYNTKDKFGNFYVYIMPDDWTQPNWRREILATNFKANNYLFGNSMTPGKHRIFYPSREYGSQVTETGEPVKPLISLSGDDDGKHYILYPLNEDKNDWTYDMQLLIDTEATTSGTMAVFDLDGDGYTEIVSAGYTAGTVHVHTFAPAK